MRNKWLEMELLSQKLHTFNLDCQCQIFTLSKFSQVTVLRQWLKFMITFGTACYTCTNGNVCASFVLISLCFCGGGHWTQVLTTLDKCSITESFWPVVYLATACSPLQTYLFVSVSLFVYFLTDTIEHLFLWFRDVIFLFLRIVHLYILFFLSPIELWVIFWPTCGRV